MHQLLKQVPPDVILLERFDTEQIPKDYLDRYFTHILCSGGSGHFQMGKKSFQISENDVVIWLPSAKITDILLSPDFKALYLFVSFDLMSKNNPDIGWGIKGYLFSQENPVVTLSEDDVSVCINNFQLLKKKYDDNEHRFQQEILNCQLQMFVMDMWNIFIHEFERQRLKNERAPLFERYLQLVQEHCMEHREVEFYADKLFITPKYLTEICKKNSSKSAMEWIQNFTTQRIIILLKNENLTLAEIADTLHFSSASFFSRYVKKMLGVSPSEYRNMNQNKSSRLI
ncbi:helix-turn-helix domain-containing protein [Draconibacterium orientale]|uniref:helix-turn-helix domain-containing protein n=1 Tax=Draconibacterium orientale TaxID=1168034 RepID=UPI0029C006A6|nr:helix-turn-helix domain-containing protein [Draconibacterium orientale]